MNLLCASFSHHTLCALMCISLTGGRGSKVARAACVLHTTFCTSVRPSSAGALSVRRSLFGRPRHVTIIMSAVFQPCIFMKWNSFQNLVLSCCAMQGDNSLRRYGW